MAYTYEQMSPGARKVVREIKQFERLQSSLSDYGAWDTEPDWHWQHALRRAMSGEIRVPFTSSGWELFSDMQGAGLAAFNLHRQARKVVGMILELTVAETPPLFEYLDDYCWR